MFRCAGSRAIAAQRVTGMPLRAAATRGVPDLSGAQDARHARDTPLRCWKSPQIPMASPLRHALLAAAFLFACDSSKPSPAQSAGNAAPAEPVKSSGPSAAGTVETYNLRGAPVKGATRRAELDLTMTDAQMTFKAGPLSFSGVMTLHVQSSDDLEILEAGDGSEPGLQGREGWG